MMKAGRELDALIAERLMGLPPFPEGSTYSQDYPDGRPCFSTDVGDAHLVEDEIERQGLKGEYVKHLAAYTASLEYDTKQYGWHVEEDDLWKIARATPEERCLAALQALGIDTH